MAEIVPSVSRYLRKLGVKKALQGRLGPLLQLNGVLDVMDKILNYTFR